MTGRVGPPDGSGSDADFSERAQKLMSADLMVGEAMLRSQVATTEVETAIRRLNSAFGMSSMEASVTMDVVQVSLVDPRLPWPMSAVRSIDSGTGRLDLLVQFDDLIRKVEAGDIDLDDTIAVLEKIAHSHEPRPRWLNSAFYLLSVGAWIVFVGGGIIGALVGIAGALVVRTVIEPLTRTRLPVAYATAAAAAVAAGAPALAAYAGIPIAMSPAVVGSLYPLLPGALIVASVTDGLSNAPISAMAKVLQATITAIAIALGALGSLTIVDRLEIVDTATGVAAPHLLVGLCAALAVSGIALSRSLPWRLVPGTAVLAIAAWSIDKALPGGSSGFTAGSFFGAVAIGAGGQLLARVQHTSASAFTMTAVFVLAPGFTTYLAMVSFAQGKTDAGVELLIKALSTSLAIAAGLALGLALTRALPLPRASAMPWNRLVAAHQEPGSGDATGDDS